MDVLSSNSLEETWGGVSTSGVGVGWATISVLTISTVAISSGRVSTMSVEWGASITWEESSGWHVGAETSVGSTWVEESIAVLLSLIGVLVLLVSPECSSVVSSVGIWVVSTIAVSVAITVRVSIASSVVMRDKIVVIISLSLVVLVSIVEWVGAAIAVSWMTSGAEAVVVSDHAGNVVVVIWLSLVLVSPVGRVIAIAVRVAPR